VCGRAAVGGGATAVPINKKRYSVIAGSLFSIFDDNSDGELSKKEWKKHMKQFDTTGEAEISDQLVDIIFDEYGAKDAEKMTKDTFCGLLKDLDSKPSENTNEVSDEDLKTAFKMIDTNNDEQIQFQELWNFLQLVDKTLTEEFVRKLFKEADSNNDGHIDREEFKIIMNKNFGLD